MNSKASIMLQSSLVQRLELLLLRLSSRLIMSSKKRERLPKNQHEGETEGTIVTCQALDGKFMKPG